MTHEAISSAQQLVQDLYCTVPVIKKGYEELVRYLETNLRVVLRGADDLTAKVSDREAELGKLDLKDPLIAERFIRDDDLQRRLSAKSR